MMVITEKTEKTCNILGYKVFNGKLEDISFDQKLIINTINPHSYNTARKDKVFKSALSNSDILLPDGIGIVLAGKLLQNIQMERITGSDLFQSILERSKEKPCRCFFLGSSEETLSLIERRLSKEYPNITFEAYSPPFKDEFSPEDNSGMIDRINSFNPDFLFVGMTAPKQEKWVYNNHDKINPSVICSIGAVFDFYAGTTQRAPKVYMKFGLEWFHRAMSSKRLFKRYLIATPLFILNMMSELFSDKNHKGVINNTLHDELT
ncbi:WecB/TagA/CpsF family glycosyltransferase [Belliella marina]|uniref:WecB/TagA/CpsF family glycosyltransferase n=1 Tax=Belliella marina TaxID=1644146 RepID=A0ABW4VM30_9BACT